MGGLMLASQALAGIRVEIDGHVVERNGAPVVLASGQAIRIQVNGDFGSNAALDAALILPGETPLTSLTIMQAAHTIRIFDDSVVFIIDDPNTGEGHFTNPVSSVGKVVIEGSADVSPFARLEFLVKANAGFPLAPAVLIPARGSINFGTTSGDSERGLIIKNPANYSDTSLARATQLALACTGEITGNITVGQVFRVQASDRLNSSAGLISANLTAIKPDSSFRSIEVVTAGSGITGNITGRWPDHGVL